MRFITATQLFDGRQFLPKDSVLVLDEKNNLKDVITVSQIEESRIENYDGIICPGFVNAHCHLELSHLKNKIQQKTGFTGFANELMAIRPGFARQEIDEAMIEADKLMWENGIVAVGDISNTDDSFDIKANSKIAYHTFIELIALNPQLVNKVMENGKLLLTQLKSQRASLSPHAPYTVSAELIKTISEEGELPITIHNQESKAENEFFKSGTGKVVELYKKLNIDISYFQPSGKSALQTYLCNLPINRNLLLVHNTFAGEDDIRFAENYSKTIFWCLCPNANLFIENALPDLNKFIEKDCKMVVGTDSLASNFGLSVLDEINIFMLKYDNLKSEEVLRWLTSNGAKALDLENEYGSFIVGKNAGLNHITLNNKQFSFAQKLA